jgi:heme exporter protein B
VNEAPAIPITKPAAARRTPGLLATTLIVLRKDLLIEWRTRARLNALIFFAVATLLMFSFALGPDTKAMRAHAAGYLWLGILFSSVLSLGESFRIEAENLALDGVKLAPADARAIFLGKALGNSLVLLLLEVVLVPVTIALFDVRIALGLPTLGAILVIGSMAISAPGTVYAAIASNARARDVLLPLLLFPILIPALLACVKASTVVIEGDPMDQLGSWLRLLIGFVVVYWSMGFVLFPRVIEDD